MSLVSSKLSFCGDLSKKLGSPLGLMTHTWLLVTFGPDWTNHPGKTTTGFTAWA